VRSLGAVAVSGILQRFSKTLKFKKKQIELIYCCVNFCKAQIKSNAIPRHTRKLPFKKEHYFPVHRK
jgi:hypothetical protein